MKGRSERKKREERWGKGEENLTIKREGRTKEGGRKEEEE